LREILLEAGDLPRQSLEVSHDHIRRGAVPDVVGALLDFPLKLSHLISISLAMLAQYVSEGHEAFSEPLQEIIPLQRHALWVLSSGHLADDLSEARFGAGKPVGP
jgi:hypothetical protein